MYNQVLGEAPRIDAIVRGKGEKIFTNLITAIDEGRLPACRKEIRGPAYRDGAEVVATPAGPPSRTSTPSLLTGVY